MTSAASIQRESWHAMGSTTAHASDPARIDGAGDVTTQPRTTLMVRWRYARFDRAAGAEGRNTVPAAIREGEVVLIAVIAADGAARADAWIEDAEGRRDVLRGAPASARRLRLDHHVHLELDVGDDPAMTLTVLLRADRPTGPDGIVYVCCDLPARAGLAGATYEIVTATVT